MSTTEVLLLIMGELFGRALVLEFFCFSDEYTLGFYGVVSQPAVT